MKNFAFCKYVDKRLLKKCFALFLCFCILLCSLSGCAKESNVKQQKFVQVPEEYIEEQKITENHIQEKNIKEIKYEEEVVSENGLYQYYYEEDLICEVYQKELVVGETTVDELYAELANIFDPKINWNLSLGEFLVGTTIIVVAGIAGGILGPSTYFISLCPYEVFRSALLGGIVNSIINVIYNGISDEVLTAKSFSKYAIEGFSEGYMFAAFGSIADITIKNIIRYIEFNEKYGRYYIIDYKGLVFDLSGQEIGKGYYENGNIIITKENTNRSSRLSSQSSYEANSIFESSDGNRCYTDDDGKIYRIDNSLIANKQYTLKDKVYRTDSSGRICKVEFEDLQLKNDERSRLEILDSLEIIGKGDAKIGDHRGHLIADMFDGDNSMANMVPMSQKANLKDVKKIENIWKKSLQEGKSVSGSIDIIYDSTSFRPSEFIYSYQIDGGEKIMEKILN